MNTLISELRTHTRFTTLASRLIISSMVACGMVTIAQLGSLLLPGWQGGYLVPLGFLISLEAFLTERYRKRLSPMDNEWFIFYVSEWSVLLILLKGILLLKGGFESLTQEVAAWRVDFLSAFFNAEFIFSLVVVFAAWLISLSLAAPLEVLRVDLFHLQIEEDIGSSPERAQARQQLVDLVLLYGLILVTLTSLMRHEGATNWFQIPILRAGVLNVMIYFMLGLILLSLTQFTVLQMRWSVNRIRMSTQLARRWALYSSLFLALLAVVSLLLPTRYTFSLLTLLGWLVAGVTTGLALLSWLVTVAFMTIIALLGSLMGTPPEQGSLPPAPVPTQLPSPEPLEIGEIPAMIRTILFWVTILALLGYSLYYFIKIRRQDISSLLRAPLVAWLANSIQWIKDWLSGLKRQASGAIQAGVSRFRRPTQPVSLPPAWRYTSLRRLTPRQRVVFYYLALIRRGGESGVPRKPAQTPYEYAERLAEGLPVEENLLEQKRVDLENITERFVEARYSLHEVTNQQAGLVQQCWQRLKRAMRPIRGDR